MSNTLKILSRPKGNAAEYGRWSVNPYVGCSHGCLYCYLKKGPSGAYLGQETPVLKKGIVNEEHAYHLAMAEIAANRDEIARDGGLFMTFTSDPCAKATRSLCFRIAGSAIEECVPVVMLTKNADFFQYSTLNAILENRDLLMNMSKDEYQRILDDGMLFQTWLGGPWNDMVKARTAFGWTLTGHDELEPGASASDERIDTMKRMSAEGYTTWASIEPVIDFPSSLEMVYRALNAGCRHFKIGLLTNNTRLVRKPFEFGGHRFKAYDAHDCLNFIDDVMRMTAGFATVYWKQSVRDLLGCDLDTKIDEYPHSVGKGWSMFNEED